MVGWCTEGKSTHARNRCFGATRARKLYGTRQPATARTDAPWRWSNEKLGEQKRGKLKIPVGLRMARLSTFGNAGWLAAGLEFLSSFDRRGCGSDFICPFWCSFSLLLIPLRRRPRGIEYNGALLLAQLRRVYSIFQFGARCVLCIFWSDSEILLYARGMRGILLPGFSFSIRIASALTM